MQKEKFKIGNRVKIKKPVSAGYYEGEAEEQEAKPVEEKKAEKKPVVKKQPPKTGFDDMDDDIPF